MVKKKEDQLSDAEREAQEKQTLAENIASISKAMKSLFDSGLNEKAIVVLLKHKTGLTQAAILAVLDGLEELEKNYCQEGDQS